jgi:hypothetical protein
VDLRGAGKCLYGGFKAPDIWIYDDMGTVKDSFGDIVIYLSIDSL